MNDIAAKNGRLPLQDQGGEGRKNGRPKLVHGVAISTSQSAATLERWLQDMCMGAWNIELDDVDPFAKSKKFRLKFENESDKRNFLTRFAKR